MRGQAPLLFVPWAILLPTHCDEGLQRASAYETTSPASWLSQVGELGSVLRPSRLRATPAVAKRPLITADGWV